MNREPARETASLDDDPIARPSKSQKKRDMSALQKLGETLVAEPRERVDAIEMPETLRDAIDDARRIHDHEGRRRQLQFIGRLMRDVDPEPIRSAVESWQGTSRAAAAALHALERWRERLVDDDGALTEFAAEHTAALNPETMQRLRATIRAARHERTKDGAAPRHARELFRLLRTIVEGTAS